MKYGEEIEIRTKKIDKARKNFGHWKEQEEIKVPKQFPVTQKKAIETSKAIFIVGVTRKEAAMLYQGVYQPTVVKTDLLDQQVSEEDIIDINAKNYHNMWIQQKLGSGYTRRTKRTGWSRILFFSKIRT